MKCVVCKQAEIGDGTTTITLERGDTTIVFKNVPARVCPNCGEDYIDESVAKQLMDSAEEMEKRGIQVEIRQFKAA
jgi:YgiT-type zinc finger domain-containing protein